MLNIIKRTSSSGTNAKPGRTLEYIVWHYTAGTTSRPGAALNTASYFAGPNAKGAAADYIVDDRDVVQYNPDIENRYCVAVGGKYATKGGALYGIAKNTNCISIELCSNTTDRQLHSYNDPAWYLTEETIARALELTLYLMKKHNIPAEHVIRHYDVSGKCCPGVVGWNEDSGDAGKWAEIKERLEELSMKRYQTMAEIEKAAPWAVEKVQRLIQAGKLNGKSGQKDAKGNPTGLDLSEDMLRIIAMLG